MSDDPREALAAVARDILAKRGYVGLTMKTAAAAAGVTPEVARRYYRNREALFAAALRLPTDPATAIPALVAPGVEGMGERLVRYTLDVLKDADTRSELVSLARTGVNAGHAVWGLQDFLETAIVDRMATMIGVPDARMRSALITSYLLGVAMMRYGVRLEPLSSAGEEEVIRMVAPVIQDLLDPRKPLPGSTRARTSAAAGSGRDSKPASSTAAGTGRTRVAGATVGVPGGHAGAPHRVPPPPVPSPAAASPPGPPRVPAARTFDPDPKATAARLAAELARAEAALDAARSPRHAATTEEPAWEQATDAEAEPTS